LRTLLTALFMTLATHTVAEQSRDAMRECFSEVENVIVMVDKLRQGFEVAFDERLSGDDLAAMFFDVGTNSYLETVFDKINNGDGAEIESLPVAQQTELLSQIQKFLSIRSVTSERVEKLANLDIKTDDQMKIADAKADYVQACVKSIEDGQHFTNLHQSEPQRDEVVDKAQPKTSSAPLTGGEKEAFKNQVLNCWAVNIGSRAANVSVIVSMDMQPDGKVVASSMEMIGYKDGNQSDANVAFQAARRAILRCQKAGYDLPKDKYEHWRSIELTFDPNEWR
jgi:GH24 family phage-related lysozyme (muramidase)